MWSVILVSIAATLAAYYYFKKTYSYFEERGIPCEKPMPFLGNVWKGIFQRVDMATQSKETYNVYPEAKYIGCYIFTKPLYIIRDVELLKSMTVKYAEHFMNHRHFLPNGIEPLFSKNLFFLQDEKWREVRAILSPTFTSSKMKTMFKLMRECAERYGETLANLSGNGKHLELKDAFTRYTNDVIATCIFGISIDSMNNPENKFYVLGREATNFRGIQWLKYILIQVSPRLARLLGMRFIRKGIEDFFVDLVASTIKTRDEQGIVRPDMLQLMMETRGKLGEGKELTIEDMTAQAFAFFFGGFESVSTLMCFATYEVGINPEIQKRLQDEIDQVLEDCNGEVTYDAINDMKYLDAVIFEALRMYPVNVVMDRMCTKPFELPPAVPGSQPNRLKPGDIILMPIYGIHYDPKYYDDPKKFDPDRFMDSKKVINSGIFWSFGMGPRMCIGNRFAILEAKVLLFHVFARCNLKVCDKTVIPVKFNKRGVHMTMEDGFWFEVEARKRGKQFVVDSV